VGLGDEEMQRRSEIKDLRETLYSTSLLYRENTRWGDWRLGAP
jgi:hypothetical protein